MEKSSKIFFIIMFFALFFVTFIGLRIFNLTGNFLVNIDENIQVGEKFNSNILISFDANEKVGSNLPVILSLIKNNSAIKVESISIEKILEYSNGDTPEKSQGLLFFPKRVTYNIEAGKILNYTFEEPGEYEFFVSIIDLNLNTNKIFLVN